MSPIAMVRAMSQVASSAKRDVQATSQQHHIEPFLAQFAQFMILVAEPNRSMLPGRACF
jgi:hypothetical protein